MTIEATTRSDPIARVARNPYNCEGGIEMPNIGPMELIVVLVIALIVLGPKRLPDAGKSLGRGIREFKGAITGGEKDDKEHELDFEAARAATSEPQRDPVA
jgi:sec-independent protein translocase protein TatA